jgi:deoxyribodipyrimidine photo-lyase
MAADDVVLVWFRQDLRLADQPTLHAAAQAGRQVLPVFVLDDAAAGPWRAGGASRWWLHHSLASLDADLRRIGAGLVLRRGAWQQEIPRLAAEAGAAAVYCGQMHEPWARRADAAVAAALQADGRRLIQHRTSTLFDLAELRTKAGGVYGVYTPFMRACRARDAPHPALPAPHRLQAAPPPHSDRLDDWGLRPTRPDWAAGLRETWSPGSAGAQARLRDFAGAGLARYDQGRNIPGVAGTSMLSPHLHWGEISPRQVWQAAAEAGGGAGPETWQNELIWRDFAAYLLFHFPHLPEAPLRAEFDRLPFRATTAELQAWQRGRTGIPIVDAGMRQLWRIGWMHNRVRMIVASFLVKHLLGDWRAGQAWFWDTLVDADLASNAASWQWVFGSGADAQPFFRVFNPVTQGTKFDPDGAYVRAWVPELARLPNRHLHAPWDAPAEVLAAAGVTLGRSYPRPLVGLDEGRVRALAAFRDTVRGAA